MPDRVLGLLEVCRAENERLEKEFNHTDAEFLSRFPTLAEHERQARERGASLAKAACCAYEQEALFVGAAPACVGYEERLWWPLSIGSTMGRTKMVEQYAWAIPCEEALAVLTDLSPIVEVGAGGGYWAMLLRDRGATVEAFDKEPGDNHYVKRLWTPVRPGRPREALRAGREHWTLFLCWPPLGSPMAEDALALHRGRYVVEIGETDGCTGTNEFYDQLEESYSLKREVALPQWPGIHDTLKVWERKEME